MIDGERSERLAVTGEEALDDLWELGIAQDLWKYLENPSHNFPGLLKFQAAFDPQLVYLVCLISMEFRRNLTAFL